MEDPILKRGDEWIEKLTPKLPTILNPSYWEDQLVQSLFASHEFQNQLFRFVDVFPALKTTENVVEHFRAYLENLELSPRVESLLSLTTSPLTQVMCQRLIKFSVEKMAKKYILAESLFSNKAFIKGLEYQGYRMSFDILGEATLTEREAKNYSDLYLSMIDRSDEINESQEPSKILNLSLKSTALIPHLSMVDHEGSVSKLVEALLPILMKAKEKHVFINIDMEQTDFHEIIYDAFEVCLLHEDLIDYEDIGIVVQAYTKDSEQRCLKLFELSKKRETSFAIRLVKGAYWDYEIAMARQRGWPIPVFTDKSKSDEQYDKLSTLLLENTKLIYPAFATHNLRSMVHISLEVEKNEVGSKGFEFQMLYGMAPAFGEFILAEGYHCRLYCPLGEMIPGMGYLVRRLLENSSNTGFLKKFHAGVDLKVLFSKPDSLDELKLDTHTYSKAPLLNFTQTEVREQFENALMEWEANFPICIGEHSHLEKVNVFNPNNKECIAEIEFLKEKDLLNVFEKADEAFVSWKKVSVKDKAKMIARCANILEEKRFKLASLMSLEVGKNWEEADADVVEAIDFCRFYAKQSEKELGLQEVISTMGESNCLNYEGRGVTLVISPWNFPLAILCGMTTASLLAGNTVVMKPAEQSALIAYELYKILLDSGVPEDVLYYSPCDGEKVLSKVCDHALVKQIAFTGSKEVGLELLQKSLCVENSMIRPVYAEMGGKNSAYIDNDTDFDEVIPHVLHSAFAFAGQKCSALSRLFIHKDIKDEFMERLLESVPTYQLEISTDKKCDVGPLIDETSFERVNDLLQVLEEDANVKQCYKSHDVPKQGYFVPISIYEVGDLKHPLMQDEFFAPILAIMCVDSFEDGMMKMNDSSFGLTASIFSRHPVHIEQAKERLEVGNLYINRGCTGAVVGRQPFGGLKLSGTGRKAGGTGYLQQFAVAKTVTENTCRHGFVSHET